MQFKYIISGEIVRKPGWTRFSIVYSKRLADRVLSRFRNDATVKNVRMRRRKIAKL